jgi:acyl-CoA thioester hydrolase
MFKTETSVRVRYAETDQMGFVYYGRYAEYFEVARVECLASLGLRYKELENKGIWLPVISYSVKFLKPAGYDDVITIYTTIPQLPGARISFTYFCENSSGDLICEAQTDLVFLNAETKKPVKAPANLVKALTPWFPVN